MTSYCDSEKSNPVVGKIVNSSALILVPAIPNTQTDCHDYLNIIAFEGMIRSVVTKFPLIDYVILLATGGMKVRYLDVSGKKIAKHLALAYSSKHAIMNVELPEICRWMLLLFLL